MCFVTCSSGFVSTDFKIKNEKGGVFKQFNFKRTNCDNCKLRNQCLYKRKDGKSCRKSKDVKILLRYDAILNDLKRVETKSFEKAYNKRYKVERRFATMVRNHGLRRCRYIKLKRAKIHITMANLVCNIVSMVDLLIYQHSIALLCIKIK